MCQRTFAVAVLALLSACSANAPTPATDTTPAASTTAGPPPASVSPVQAPTANTVLLAATTTTVAPSPTGTAPAFVGTLWRAAPGTGVEAGSTYTFRRDGTLQVASPHGTPSTGQWRYENGKLTMVEEGIAYPTDIVSQDATHLVLRSHNPGGPVEIALEADSVPAQPRP